MNSRIGLIRNQLSANKIVDSCVDYLHFDDLLSQEDKKFRQSVRTILEENVKPVIHEYVEKAEFPRKLVEKLGELEWAKLFLKKPYGEEKSLLMNSLAILEIARVDAGLATFFAVQINLAMYTIEIFGSEDQKKKYLPDMAKLKHISGWALTEKLIGSDASSLETSVKKVENGYILNGNKRWIGNSNGEMICCWARNQDTKKVECFIVPLNSKGVTVDIIKRKLALRIVQNGQLSFDNVFIPEENRLPGATQGFESTNKILMHSRIVVAWVAVGCAVGVYDNVINYSNQRKQFGKKITGFQLTQEKLSRMMAIIHAMLLTTWNVTNLYEKGKCTIGRVAMVKAWNTRMLREVSQLGREIIGGNGILIENYAMKALADAEAIYTYEGTYDINSLVTGRELTGIAAFK